MSKVYRFPEPNEDPTAEACEWLARLNRGLTEQEGRELREWLATSPKRAAVFIESAGVWDRMDSLGRLADLFPKPVQRRRALGPRTLALAASVVILLGAGLLAFFNKGKTDVWPTSDVQIASAPQEQLFETEIGEASTVRLADGSELTLNTNSRVRVLIEPARRTLHLERGEMFIKVAHDASRPLTVWASDRLVRAVGTAFNVLITQDQSVEVIVTDGKVLVGIANIDAAVSDAAWIEDFSTPVVAGQRAVLSDQSPAVEDLGATEIDVKLSWRDGNLVFRGEPLAEALGEIERYTRVTFVIRNEELKTIRVAGHFKAGDVDGLLATLRENFNISYERVGAEKIILKAD